MSVVEKEKEILTFWESQKIFQTQLEQITSPRYVFYDGPPFATGKPHYGHILAGTIKDVITRYQSMHQKFVPRQFGWDCHGVPVENIVDETLAVKSSKNNLSLQEYNNECRKVVMQCEKDWEYTVERMGRWIDFKNSYKTMDLSYMNELWKIFQTLFEKGLIYKGFKVMPYSLTLGTPLSNFEANLNYKTVNHTDIIVEFPLKKNKKVCFLAWTTTPWTLPAHVALCVHPNNNYIEYYDSASDKHYIVQESMETPKTWKQIQKYIGQDLVGIEYHAPFYYYPRKFTVVADEFVKKDVGTGIIHLAPSFGEDDFRVCKKLGITEEEFPFPINSEGYYLPEITHFANMHIFSVEKQMLKYLKQYGILYKTGSIQHSYPHCWRSDTPLIYRTVHSWFLRVETLKDKMLKNNKKVKWIPEHIGESRFHHWLEQANDWCLSRSRCWGTPIPIWVSEDGEEVKVISSLEELQSYTRQEISDLHRETIDSILIPSEQGKGFLKRIPEVFDCWYESGAVPMVQSSLSGNSFTPAEFVAEGIDQTRGWFYTMMVLATALYDEAPYKNVICSGLVLAHDGKKMSKRLNNYTSPDIIMEKYGADALRMYLLNSPVVKGETLRFKDESVYQIVKDISLPILNATNFWKEYCIPYTQVCKASNPMDLWMQQYTDAFVEFLDTEMGNYKLYNVVDRISSFVQTLTNTYLRMNRFRMKEGEAEPCYTLYSSLYRFSVAIAPIAPFLAEQIYQNLRSSSLETRLSVHLEPYPRVSIQEEGKNLAHMEVFQQIVEMVRRIRDTMKRPLKTPIHIMKVVYPDKETVEYLETYMKTVLERELNCMNIVFETDILSYATVHWVPNLRNIGRKFGKNSRQIVNNILEGTLMEDLVIGEDVVSEYKAQTQEGWEIALEGKLWVGASLHLDENMVEQGIVREVFHMVNMVRKENGLKAKDECSVYITPFSEHMQKQLEDMLGDKTEVIYKNIPSKHEYQGIYVSLV